MINHYNVIISWQIKTKRSGDTSQACTFHEIQLDDVNILMYDFELTKLMRTNNLSSEGEKSQSINFD